MLFLKSKRYGITTNIADNICPQPNAYPMFLLIFIKYITIIKFIVVKINIIVLKKYFCDLDIFLLLFFTGDNSNNKIEEIIIKNINIKILQSFLINNLNKTKEPTINTSEAKKHETYLFKCKPPENFLIKKKLVKKKRHSFTISKQVAIIKVTVMLIINLNKIFIAYSYNSQDVRRIELFSTRNNIIAL